MTSLAPGPRRALVVTFDQFPAAILGCYGNEWIDTPHFDALASRGLVADQCWAARIDPVSAEEAFAAATGLAELRAEAIPTQLFQEAASQIDFAGVPFDRTRELSGELGPDAKPDRIPLAELVRAAQAEWKSAPGESRLLWLHARGLIVPASPPAGFAELYYDEFEDRGVNVAALPEDERRSHPAASAGMASLLDHWLGQLLESVAESQSLLVIVTASQGAIWQPLPNSFGDLDALRAPAVQVPLLIHSDAIPSGHRSSTLFSTRDLGPLLAWWFASQQSWSDWLAERTASHAGRIETLGPSARRITMPEWGAIIPQSESQPPLLFHKPEDYWDVNNVAATMPDVVEILLPPR